MGGAKGGRVASSLCLELISNEIEQISSPSIEDIVDTISKANRTLFLLSERDEALRGMGTTLVLFASLKDGNYSIHVGDSRLYCLKNNNLQILTRDHTYAQELIDSGTLSESSAKRSPISHLLTKAIGTEKTVEAEISKIEHLQSDDILILSSDGLYAHLNRKRIEELLLESIEKNSNANNQSKIKEITDKLLEHTLLAGASDNTTILTIKPTKDPQKVTKFTSFISGNSGVKNSDISSLEDFTTDPTSTAILNSAHAAAVKNDPNYRGNDSYLPYFLMGISITLGLALWGIVNHEENTDQQALRSSAKINQAIKQILEDRKITHKEPLTTPQSTILLDSITAYGFTSEKYAEIFHLPLKAPEITIGSDVLHEDLALAPIEWQSDREKIEAIKSKTATTNSTSNQGTTSNQLSPSEKVDLLNKKMDLVEAIWDIDFRISSLGIADKESEEKARTELADQKVLIEKDILSVKQINSVIAKKSIAANRNSHLLSVHELLNYVKGIPNRTNSIENLRQRYLSEEQNISFYSNLIKDTKSQLEMANRISSINQKMKYIEDQLREEIKTYNQSTSESTSEHLAILSLLEDLMNREDKRISRSLGFIGAYTKLNNENKVSIWENLIQRRNELYSEYNLLEKSLPSEKEFKEQVLIRKSSK
jgi:protein phosphatase